MAYCVMRDGFFQSALAKSNRFQSFNQFLSWFEDKKKAGRFIVERIPFSQMDQWYFAGNNEAIVHTSGKFFSIEGLKIATNFGNTPAWNQPIINQPEIGILGILSKVFDGVRYFLMQVKMEPGNVNTLQLSPTVQATKSNFSQVHKGKLPAYLAYFVEKGKSKVLIDQLQTEQGGRFLRKRNRNIVIDVSEDVDILEDFAWLTLREIKQLLCHTNFVNMDARSVLSTIPLIDEEQIVTIKQAGIDTFIEKAELEGLSKEIVISICRDMNAYRSKEEVISWYTDQIVAYEINTKTIPLSSLEGWILTEDAIFQSDRFFSVIAVSVEAGNREVSQWTQPLFADTTIGLLGFITKKINGILHFLVQAKVEPGHIDVVELSPTISCSNYRQFQGSKTKPLFYEYFAGAGKCHIHFDAIQSEEGGRFYHVQNRNMIVEIDENEQVELPKNFMWMTLAQIMDFMRFSMFNIEARSLISCLSF